MRETNCERQQRAVKPEILHHLQFDSEVKDQESVISNPNDKLVLIETELVAAKADTNKNLKLSCELTRLIDKDNDNFKKEQQEVRA
ncbi:hypothetical protein HDU98_000330 [Podochytrium sp. JEL0797]|nr:hypothetical protein HDU98_000328 [Podochytrium sp. JEL0797]KAJ3063929.1 hypothetical protein HDU98_000330 [Podochytrium sp. JEL0797]